MPFIVSDTDVEFSPIRAQGPGGQHVNKSATAVQLRFDIAHSRLPEAVKTRLLACSDSRVSSEGVVVIKAQGSRSLSANKAEALARLQELVESGFHVPKARRPTKPTKASKVRRLDGKTQRATVKSGRAKVQV